MDIKSWAWVRFGAGQPVKVSIAECQDVADLIEATRNKLGLSDRLDEMYLLVLDTDGFKGKQQRPGKLLTQVLQENHPAGQNDLRPLVMRKVNQSQWQPVQSRTIRQDGTVEKIKSFFLSEWESMNWFTIISLGLCIWNLEPFSLYSATFLFIALKIAAYVILKDKPDLERRHFVCSWDNFLEKRYWTLVTSSLAHADINHLLCNISALAINGPWLESIVGFRVALLFFCLASAVSGAVSLKAHGHPSIGSSGVLFAIDGVLTRLVDNFDWRVYVFEYAVGYALFCLATKTFYKMDHVAHAGGFLFGYLVRDIVLYQYHTVWQY